MLEHVGTKWNPRIDGIAAVEGGTHLAFDSAWSPPANLLKRLHELTGWKIVNRHDDPDAEHDPVMTCEGGSCTTEYLPGTTTCSNCDDRVLRDELDDFYGECPVCFANRATYLVAVEADWPASINTGEKGSADLCGDVVLGIVSAHSKRQAMSFVIHRIPEAARQDDGWYNDPEGFGLKVYKLADREEGEG